MYRSLHLSLLQFVEYDVRSAFRLLCGLFFIGITFTGVTLPYCYASFWAGVEAGALFDNDSGDDGPCMSDYLTYLHWALLFLFMLIQIVQLPFRLFNFMEVFYLSLYARDAGFSRERLIESFKTVMERRSWQLNQWLGFVGQYLVPSTGFALLVILGTDRIQTDQVVCPMFGSGSRGYQQASPANAPSGTWSFLVIAMLVRVLVTFIWGYFSTGNEINQVVRGASQTMISRLPTLTFGKDEAAIYQARCAVCISDFEHGEQLTRLPCDDKHVFHSGCVKEWLVRCKACPLCMTDVDAAKSVHAKSS